MFFFGSVFFGLFLALLFCQALGELGREKNPRKREAVTKLLASPSSHTAALGGLWQGVKSCFSIPKLQVFHQNVASRGSVGGWSVGTRPIAVGWEIGRCTSTLTEKVDSAPHLPSSAKCAESNKSYQIT